MAQQIQQTNYASEKATQEAKELAEADTVNPEIRAKAETTMSDLDTLLDEIDEVLEENAAEFVAAYIQRGGE
jgi:ubiquitin-like protein Pup